MSSRGRRERQLRDQARRRRRPRPGPGPSGSRRSRRRPAARSPPRGRSGRRGARTGLPPRSGPRPLPQVLETQVLVAASGWPAGSARRSGSSSRAKRRIPARAARRHPRIRTAARGRTRRAQARGDLLRLVLGEGHLDPGCEARKAAIAGGINVAPAVGKEAIRSRPPRPPAIASTSAWRLHPGQDRLGVGDQRRPGDRRSDAAPVALDQRRPASSSSVAIACETADCE